MFPLRQYKFTVCFLKLVMDRLGGRRPPQRHARQKTCFELGRYGRHGIIDDELSSCIGRVESIGPGHYGRFIRREGIHSATEPHDAGDAAVEYATFTGKLRPALLAILLKTKRKQLY